MAKSEASVSMARLKSPFWVGIANTGGGGVVRRDIRSRKASSCSLSHRKAAMLVVAFSGAATFEKRGIKFQ